MTFGGGQSLEWARRYNFRDLGALPVRQGGVTRRGVLFRSGSLVGLDDAAALALRHTLGVRAFYDLRSEREQGRDGTPDALVRAGMAWRCTALGDGEPFLAGCRVPRPSQYAAAYLAQLPDAVPVARRLLEVVAEGDDVPLAFGCTAGKDRTGLVAALVLSAVGVRDRVVARDYALTARYLRPRLDEFEPQWTRKGLTRAEFAVRLEPVAETMRSVLSDVRRRHGSAARALLDDGLSPEAFDAARDRLVDRRQAQGGGG